MYSVNYKATIGREEQKVENDKVYYYLDPHYELEMFDKVLIGGTFDHLHIGHEKLLFAASTICKRMLIVGVTAESMLKRKKYKYCMDSIQTRRESVWKCWQKVKSDGQELKIVTIFDPFGPAITMEHVDAIVVSTETLKGAKKINQIRNEKGWNSIHIIVLHRNNPHGLSSTVLRNPIHAMLQTTLSFCNKC